MPKFITQCNTSVCVSEGNVFETHSGESSVLLLWQVGKGRTIQAHKQIGRQDKQTGKQREKLGVKKTDM